MTYKVSDTCEIQVSKVLSGHDSPETAYVVNDYPYGFRLRCKIRYWLEYRKGKGFRFMSQTTNPKLSTEVWNKPKASPYADLGVMYLDEKGYTQWISATFYRLETLEEYATTFAEGLQDEPHQKELKNLRAMKVLQDNRKQKASKETIALGIAQSTKPESD